MNNSETLALPTGFKRLKVCWTLVTIGLVSTAVASLMPESPIGIACAGIQFLSMLLFVITHASLTGGWRAVVGFMVIVCLTSFALEGLSIATGFPFGYFEHFTPGPRLFGVPAAVPIG